MPEHKLTNKKRCATVDVTFCISNTVARNTYSIEFPPNFGFSLSATLYLLKSVLIHLAGIYPTYPIHWGLNILLNFFFFFYFFIIILPP